MGDESENKPGAMPSGSSPKSTTWAWQLVAGEFALFLVGGHFFQEALNNPRGVEPWELIGPWSLAIVLGACALLVVYRFGVAAQSKVAIVTAAVLGMVLNALPFVLFALLWFGFQKTGR
jgi:hypothetical protein